MADSPLNTPLAQPPHAPVTRAADWPRAWRALRALIADPQRTDQVAQFIVAVGGSGDLRAVARFRAHPGGKRLLAERPSLPDVLSDLPRLAALPAGSFGRAASMAPFSPPDTGASSMRTPFPARALPTF